MSEHNKDNASSFYIPSLDEVVEYVKDRPTSSAEDIFLREIYHLNDPGPFFGEEGRIALRAFAYKDVTLFGFLVEETREAFMVLLPASLSRDEEGVKATQIIASPLAKLMKSSVGIMSLPTPVQTLYYLSLSLKQFGTCPGYFTEVRIQQITNLVGMLKIAMSVSETVPLNDGAKPKAEAIPKKDTFQVPDSLIPRITH
jgi:hypothetical protein